MVALTAKMLTAVAAWAVTGASSGLPMSQGQDLVPRLCARDFSDADDFRDSLSPGARVYLPGTPEFEAASSRWSVLDAPWVNIVVVPATSKDISITIKFANKKGIPFLAFNGAHGAITTLGQMNSGINIYLDQLDSIKIAADGKTAKIGGGALSKAVIDTLWAAGKQTVTGTCECVSLLGPGLGGGHGWLQGHYGLVQDQFVSMDIVLANGELQTVNNSSDIWWALQGAGHNFGIVTSVTTKLYELTNPAWAVEIIIFSGSKVGAVYNATNNYLLKNGTQPVDIINWSYWVNDPTTDPNNPIILFYIIQEGVTAVDSKYTQPFHNLGPIAVQPLNGTYRDLAGWTGIAATSPPCQKLGLANPRFPIYLQSYNVASMQQAYNLYAAKTRGSSPFSGSNFMFEGYSTQGVKAIDPFSTAYSFREANLLAAPLITYKPNGTALDNAARDLGNQLRNILYQGSGVADLRAYVNYAYGDETPSQWYGSEAWRRNRLKALKNKYDPLRKFNFYGPIP